ncbi:hypothetical protein Scep_012319 [Stephania cephalantha]|uniref:Potassium transporter n=1 Tax=Stephania cephalantha TaxID=152367 RepID=A0AAP0P9R2_9MAGN
MDLESETRSRESRLKAYKTTLCLAYQSFGVVYGDLSISPIYVYTNTFSERSHLVEDDDEILGVLSLVFWTLTLIPLCKYIIFVLGADDNGEGGTFAIYSLLCRHSKMGLLNTYNAVHERLSACNGDKFLGETKTYSTIQQFFEKYKSSRILLFLFVVLGTSMVIGDGILTPTMSVLSAVYGIKTKVPHLHEDHAVLIACLLLVAVFALQHYGTHRVGFLFAPILIAWLLCISGIGIYNLIRWNPSIIRALSPYYVYHLFATTGRAGWSSLGGAEAMFADIGHFSQLSIRLAFTVVVYPSLIVAYMGEAAYLSKHKEKFHRSFYRAIPGLAVISVMLVTTCLMFLVIVTVWRRSVFVGILFVVVFGSIELLYFTACLTKIHKGGWLPLFLSLLMLTVMSVWHYGTLKKEAFESQNRVQLEKILSLGPSLDIVRIPGIGLIYSNIITGAPPMFSHFVANFPAFHQILIFVSLQSMTVPKVPSYERFLISRIGPPECHLYRCVIRYGYKDARKDSYHFENELIAKMVEFLRDESDEGSEDGLNQLTSWTCSENPSGQEVELVETGPGSQSEAEWHQKVRYRGVVMSKAVKELVEARDAGVAYMMGHTCVKACNTSSAIKKFAIDVLYGFLRQNCRRPAVALGLPHTSLIEVGMLYHVAIMSHTDSLTDDQFDAQHNSPGDQYEEVEPIDERVEPIDEKVVDNMNVDNGDNSDDIVGDSSGDGGDGLDSAVHSKNEARCEVAATDGMVKLNEGSDRNVGQC